MSNITHVVTPVPEITTYVSKFVCGITPYDIINMVIALGSLAYVLYLSKSYKKYKKHMAKDNEERDKRIYRHISIDHNFVNSNTTKHTTKEPAVRQQSTVTKPRTNDPSVRRPSAKKDSIRKVGEK